VAYNSGECLLVAIGGSGNPVVAAVPLFLFLLMAREALTCADASEFLNSIRRWAVDLLAACRCIGVRRRRNRHPTITKNGVKTGASAAVLSRC
jgi:hypothetical protein